jgi:hypothetical protein
VVVHRSRKHPERATLVIYREFRAVAGLTGRPNPGPQPGPSQGPNHDDTPRPSAA